MRPTTRRVIAATGRVAAGLGALLVSASASYLLVGRRAATTWGATPAEADGAMPGDDLVAGAATVTTRAVTIHARPDQVWPWLVQLGQGRGGLYSYDLAERLVGVDIRNADRILPEHQRLAPGDPIWVTQPGYPAKLVFVVAGVEPTRSLLLAHTERPQDRTVPAQTGWTWSFTLSPVGSDSTRLVLRSRNEAFPNPVARALSGGVIDPIAFVMERRTLLGIRDRAERTAGVGRDSRAERVLWVSLFLGAAGAVAVVVSRRRPWWWRLGAGAASGGLLAAALFRGFPNPLYGALADAAIAAFVVLTYRSGSSSRADIGRRGLAGAGSP